MTKVTSTLRTAIKLPVLVLSVLVFSFSATAQVNINIGTGTANNGTGYPCPIQDFWETSRSQYLYKASELTAKTMTAGYIYSIAFNVTNVNTTTGIDQLQFTIGHTNATTLSSTSWDAFSGATNSTAVFTGTITTGYKVFTFTTPFFWNGVDNILIEACSGDPNNATSFFDSDNPSITLTNNLSFNGSHNYADDDLGNGCGTTVTTNIGNQTSRPNIRFNWLKALPCTGAPNAGTATANPTTACLGQIINLTNTGSTVASSLQYNWEDSTATSTQWDTIAGGNVKNFSVTQSVPTWYRLKIKCLLTGDSVYTNTVYVYTPPIIGGVYTIDKTGCSYPAAGCNNFISFNAAYNAMKCGINAPTIFNVVSGTGPYTEQLIINGIIPGASPINTITFNGNGETIKFTSSSANERAVVKIKNSKYFIFDSLTVDATAGTYGFGVQLINGADSNIIRKCEIKCNTTATNTNYAGLVVSSLDNDAIGNSGTVKPCRDNIFSDNTITGGNYGITQVSNTGTTGIGAHGRNTFTNNKIRDFYRYGFYTDGSFSTTFDKNKISRPNRTTLGAFDGIYVKGINIALHIYKNRIYSPYGTAPTNTTQFSGITLDGANAGNAPSLDEKFKLYNNAIYDVKSNGIQYGIYNNNTSNVEVVNNTISLDHTTATGNVNTRGYFQNGGAASVTVLNNLITISRGGPGSKHCVYIGTPASAAGGIDNLDFNNYYQSAVTGNNNFIAFYDNKNYTTVFGWQLATIWDDSTISVDPVYYNPNPPSDESDYSPTNAGMDNRAQFGGLIDDIRDSLRSTTAPDMGAWEFVPPPCVPASMNGATNINVAGNKVASTDTTVCEGTQVVLDLDITGAYGNAQVFQWERTKNLSNTPEDFGGGLTKPTYGFITNDTDYYYRCKVSCQGNDYYSDWRLIRSWARMPAGNYYITNIDTTYLPGNAGGHFLNFRQAYSGMKYCGIRGNGDVVMNVVAGSGPYTEQLRMDSIAGVSQTSQIWFKGNYNKIQFPAVPTNNNARSVIKLLRSRFINFDSLEIDASVATTFGYGIQLLNNSDSNSVRNCIFTLPTNQTSNDLAGVVINGAENGTATAGSNSNLCDGNIFDNNIFNGGYYGISIAGGTATGIPSKYNVISNNKFNDFYSTGVYVSGSLSTVIDKNIFTRPTRASVAQGIGVLLSGVAPTKTVISNNRFTSFYGANPTSTLGTQAISFNNVDATSGNENLVFNNAFYNLDGYGATYAMHNNGSDYAFYVNNSVSLDNANAPATGLAAGLYQTTAATGLRVKNNIVSVIRGGTGNKYGFYYANTSTTPESDFNNVWGFFNTNATHYWGFIGANKKTLPQWKVSFTPKQDTNSFDYDPIFVDAINGNLKPQFYALDNKAEEASLISNTDILNQPRGIAPSAPDMGAWEFSPAPCATPILTGTATVTPQTGICLEVPIHLETTGYSALGSINFQWQDSIKGGSWQNLGPILFSPGYDTISSVRNYYRCKVTCVVSKDSVFSNIDSVNLNPLMPQGTYTIDSSKGTNYTGNPGENFQTFKEAIIAMKCGILGPVIFDVQKGTYNEKVYMPYVPGLNANATVTFQGNGGVSNDKIIVSDGKVDSNYVLRFDSCSYVTFKNLTFVNTSNTYGRVVDFVVKASYDNLLNCTLITPTTNISSPQRAGVYSAATRGVNLTIKGNNISGGVNGIYFSGVSTANPSKAGHIIDSNTINDCYGSGIYLINNAGIKVTNNTVTYNAPALVNASTAAIYAESCDSGFVLKRNHILLENTNSAINGIYVTKSKANSLKAFEIVGNEVYANSGNTGGVTGIYITISSNGDVRNNVMGINSGNATSYGLYNKDNTGDINYYNNTVNITTAGATTVAAYLTQATTGKYNLKNNIFSNVGGGKAIFMNAANNFTSDYNFIYTTGSVLGTVGATNYANIVTWRKNTSKDKWSMVYPPALISKTDLRPDVNDANSWAMQSRATQIRGNIEDINGNFRPDSLTIGAPDMGAYEFFPAVPPPNCIAKPSTVDSSVMAITPGREQIFYFGSDTVMRIKWDSLVHPPSVEVRRFSGVVPSNITQRASPNVPNKDSMYFYTQVIPTGGNYYNANVKTYYIEPWLGSTPQYPLFDSSYHPDNEYLLGIGRNNPANKWIAAPSSKNTFSKERRVYESYINYLDKFTGLINPFEVPPAPCKNDTSNEGKRFLVPYTANQLAGTETFYIYLSAKETAEVTVEIPYWNYKRDIVIPAGQVYVVDDPINLIGIDRRARHNESGKWPDAVIITSDVPIVAYAHCWGSASSGATMLMPYCTWGYEYRMLAKHNNWGAGSFSSYAVVSDNDNTKLSINNTVTPSGVPQVTEVTLNRGEWYQVLAQSGNDDLSGSSIKSIPNDVDGKCYPFAMFSGDTRTSTNSPCGGGGDFMIQQNFAGSTWGYEYLSARTSQSTGCTNLEKNLFRIALKDANQKVWVNGTEIYPAGNTNSCVENLVISPVTVGGIPAYIEFLSGCDNYIKSDWPMLVAQFLSGACAGVGDPDMAYISSREQGINDIYFYRNTVQAITTNVLTLIGSALDTPKIAEGAAGTPLTWTCYRSHSNYPGKLIYVKHWAASASTQVHVWGDSAFTALTYGLGSVESYMYNAGTNLLNLNIEDKKCNKDVPECKLDKEKSPTCSGTDFTICTGFPLLPDSILWQFSKIPGIKPTGDVLMKPPYNPPPTKVLNNKGDTIYYFCQPSYYNIPSPGYYRVPVWWWHPNFEGCDKKRTDEQEIQVLPSPTIDFTYSPNPICPKTSVVFTADTVDNTAFVKINQWSWLSNYGINAQAQTTNTTSYYYANPGSDTVKLHYRTQSYCVGDTSHILTINPNPVVTLATDSMNVCYGNNATITLTNVLAGATYTVYDAATGGIIITKGDGSTPFVLNNMTKDTIVYIDAVSATGCISEVRKAVKVTVTPFPQPVAVQNAVTACVGTAATFSVQAPVSGATYSWYNVATAGTAITTGNDLTINPVVNSDTYYLEATINGCVSNPRYPVALTAATPPSLAVVSNAVTVCAGDPATFSIQNPVGTVTYNWYTAATGGTATTGSSYTINNTTTSAAYFVSATSAEGCTTSPRLQVDLTVNQRPVVTIVSPDNLKVCKGATAQFSVSNPVSGAKYDWYNATTGGLAVATNTTTFTTPPVTGAASYYVEGNKDGCVSISRATVSVDTLKSLDTFSITYASRVYADRIEFMWRAITTAGLIGYEVSENGGPYKAPTNIGAATNTHQITGLTPGAVVTLKVKAIAANPCQNSYSDTATGITAASYTFYPNAFTPGANNTPGTNDRIVVCGKSIKEIKYAVFNQWGQKIWETSTLELDANPGCYKLWDGTHNGVPQPAGVYMYASRIVYLDGTTEVKKGSINLIR